jgi:hypothetical protein
MGSHKAYTQQQLNHHALVMRNKVMKTTLKHLELLCISIFLLLVAMLQWQRLEHLTSEIDSQSTNFIGQERLLESQLDLLRKTPTFGFKNLLADWVFLQFLQYFGDEPARQQTGYRLSPLFFEPIIENDPLYTLYYLFLSTSSSIYAASPGYSVLLMEEGLKSMTPEVPDDAFLVWRYKAIDELLFLGDSEAARQSYLKAAEWADQSSHPEAMETARLSREAAEFLAQNPSSKPARINAWVNVLLNAVDRRTQQLAIQKIEELGGTITIENGELRVDYRVEEE